MSTLTSSEIGITFLALTLLLIFSFIGGKLCELIKAPKVVGEIIGGMILGGSFIGYCWPDFFTSIFNAYSEEHKVLNIFYQLGLVFLMFSSGYTTSININKKNTISLNFFFNLRTFLAINTHSTFSTILSF